MGTNSQIFYEKSPNEFHGISCHFDGYLSGVGATLYKHYQTQDKIEKLISLGDISSLDKECEVAPRYQQMGIFETEQRHLGYTFAYHRDYGDEFNPPTIVDSLDKLTKHFHVYVWKDDTWFTYDYERKEWKLLKDALIALAKENDRDPNYYTYIPKTVEITLSHDDYIQTISRSFLITKKDSQCYSSGDYIKFKAIKDNKPYELLLRVNDIVESDGIKEDYQLIILSQPPKDFAWFHPVSYLTVNE